MGGGIYIQESGVIVEDNIIKNNRLVNAGDTYGGGISVLKILGGNRFVIIRNNSIAHNFLKGNMTGAGGIYIGWKGEPVTNYIIENNIISNNIVENTDNWKVYGRRDIFRMCFTIYRYKNSKKHIIKDNELHCMNSFGGGYILLTGMIYPLHQLLFMIQLPIH